MNAAELAERVESRFPDAIVARGEVTVIVEPPKLLESLEWLREEPDLWFDFLSDLSASDWPDRDPRFWVAYHLTSTRHSHRIRVKTGAPEKDARLPSATGLFPTANWHEREVFDMFGVRFDGHPGLTRIFMPDDWEGHPQRKTESLGGVPTRYHGAFIPPVDERLG